MVLRRCVQGVRKTNGTLLQGITPTFSHFTNLCRKL